MMHAAKSHNSSHQGKMMLTTILKNKDDNWRGKMYQMFQINGIEYFTEMKVNKYSFDYRDILNCLCKFRREDKHLKKECRPLSSTDYEYKQNEIDEDSDLKEFWEEFEKTVRIMTDEKYFIIYIPHLDIMMYRVEDECDFFVIPQLHTEYEKKIECRIIPNTSASIHMEMTKRKCLQEKQIYYSVIGFYIR